MQASRDVGDRLLGVELPPGAAALQLDRGTGEIEMTRNWRNWKNWSAISGAFAIGAVSALALSLVAVHPNVIEGHRVAAPNQPRQPPSPEPPSLAPGPHSAVADVDLPAGTVQVPDQTGQKEHWRYNVSYGQAVTFLQDQFGTGRKYDSYGATWWGGLPPCYDANHQAPPKGWERGDFHDWVWSDGAVSIVVEVYRPGAPVGGGETRPDIWIFKDYGPPSSDCYRA